MKPLTKKQRYLSISVLAVLFILFAPVIVLYSLGYTLDKDFSIQKTGGIFIHSDVANTSVFVNKDFFKSNGIFVRNTLIQDLVPNKRYLVEVQKNGYQSWRKEIFVYPSIVSEGSVLMMPNEFDKREILKYIDKNKVATSTPLVKGQKPNNSEYISVAEVFASSTMNNLNKTVEISASSTASSTQKQKSDLELFFEKNSIDNYSKLKNLIVNGKEVSWLDKGDIQLYWIDEIDSMPFYYCGGEEERICETKITLDWNDEIKRFEYLPGRTDGWIVLTSHGIYAVEVDGRTERNIQTMYKGENIDFRLTQTDNLIIKEGNSFFEINL
ncbi:MAG: hypothetical protein RLZZ517_355 [Candidatus Parcubacteria bacterium]|jgi:hypothetical protein